MSYNMSAIESANHIGGMAVGVDTATGGLFFPMTCITVLGIVLLVLVKGRKPIAESFFAASSVSTIYTMLLVAGEFMNEVWIVGFGLVWALSGVALYLKNKAG